MNESCPQGLIVYLNCNFLFRHIFVYHDDPQTVVNWYHAIRCCKLHLLQVGFPSEAESELLSHLSQDYTRYTL